MTNESPYILGTDDQELDRLRHQHQAWVEQAYSLWARTGLRSGHRVLDLGCGPGFTSFELAHVVGPSGHVIARDVSPRFMDFLRSECQRTGAPVEPSLGPVEELELAAASLDAAYARWLFCWLPDPVAAVVRVAQALKPGGALLLQDYVDWATMKLIPRDVTFDRVIDVCMQSWAEGGGTIDVCDLVPGMAAEAGLVVEHLAPVSRIGAVGSLEWGWLGGFFESYLPRLEQRGSLDQATHAAFRAEWQRRDTEALGYIVAPTLANVILRKPRSD